MMKHKQGTECHQMYCMESAIASDSFVRAVDAIDLKSFGFSPAYCGEGYTDCQEEGRTLFGTLKRQRGVTFTLMRGKEKVKREVGLMFFGYYLSRSVSVIEAEKIRALRERCLTCFWRGFGLVLSHFKQFMEKSKAQNIFSIQKFYGLYGGHIYSDVLSLVGK